MPSSNLIHDFDLFFQHSLHKRENELLHRKPSHFFGVEANCRSLLYLTIIFFTTARSHVSIYLCNSTLIIAAQCIVVLIGASRDGASYLNSCFIAEFGLHFNVFEGANRCILSMFFILIADAQYASSLCHACFENSKPFKVICNYESQ